MFCTPEVSLKARKSHRCTWCNERIEAGSKYWRWANSDDDGGGMFTNKVHPDCRAPLALECAGNGGSYLPYENER